MIHEVELTGAGMQVKNTALFLDAKRSTDLSFVSHAHSDHAAHHRRILATQATLKLLALRLGKISAALPVPYRQPFELGNLTLELLPAGHVLGSAQIRVTRNGRRIVYTGDLNTAPGLTAEPAEVAQCEVLVIESTFGHPRYRFPKRAEIYGEVCSFARKSLEEGAVPVFLAYVLGKGQEAVRLLADAGFSVAVHPSIAGVCDIYRELGCFLKYRRFDGEIEANEVLVVPAHLARAPELNRLGKTRTAVLTGWALDKGARFRYGTDAAFALSDHADFDALVQYVAQSGASKIFTVHGFAKELAACLRDRGFHAQPLAAPRQMELF